jgi:hypothetical protein
MISICRWPLLTFVLAIAVGATVHAEPIAVVNHSFEDPATNRNGVPSLPGWTQQENAPGESFNSGVWRPTVPSDFTAIPDGSQVAYIQAGSIFQVLPALLTANTQYDLVVEVGEQAIDPIAPDGYAVQLRAGSTILAEATSPDPPNNGFITTSVSYVALAGNPNLGQPLAVWLIDKDPSIFENDPNFDNVRLTATNVISEPVTAVFALWLPIAAVAIHRLRKRRRLTGI